jgi:hypothetical protein
MTSNVIAFPQKEETVEIRDRISTEEDADSFANEIVEIIHNALHDRTGECIFTDDEYTPITICIGEVITALYMLSQGFDDHPFQQIATEIFGDEVDISDEEGYTGENANNEEP